MFRSKPLQLLTKTSNGYDVNIGDISKILDKIGDRKVAIVSINGNKRTGKSFLLNYFMRYLKYRVAYGKDWIYGIRETSLQGFDWRGGAERNTEGIWIWSGFEPFTVKSKDGSYVALILLDTQGNFDEKTTFQECGVIFSLSLLLSSTMILNIKSDLSEDKLQFVEFFTSFAETFSGETNLNEKLFQRLLFLVRDWEKECSYPYGYHDNLTPDTSNFKRDVINPNDSQCKEAQNTRTEILSYFSHVSSFLMPHPGKKVSKTNFNGQTDLIDDDFIDIVSEFVPLILSNIETKKIGGHSLTGKTLKDYLIRWTGIIKSNKLPEVKTLVAATADVNYMLAMKNSLALYEYKMRSHLATNPSDDIFCVNHNSFENESYEYFLRETQGNISNDRKSELFEDLRVAINLLYNELRTNNQSRIDKELSELKLNNAICEQNHLKSKSLMEERENAIKLSNLKTQISNLEEEAKTRQLEQRNRFNEENFKLQQNLFEQNLNHFKAITEIEQKNAYDKLEIERKYMELRNSVR